MEIPILSSFWSRPLKNTECSPC